MKKFYLLSVAFVFFLNVFGQDQQLTSLNQSLLETNPSFAGSNGGIRNQFVFRRIWPGFRGFNGAFYNGLDAYVKPLKGGLAISFMEQNIASGLFKNTQANFIYAPHFKCVSNELIIIPSIQLSYLQTYLDKSRVYLPPGAIVPSSAYQKRNFDASFGLLVNYKALYAGVSAFHVNQPDVAMPEPTKLYVKYSANVSYNMLVGSNTQLNFQTIYTNHRAFQHLHTRVNALFLKHLIVGLGWSNAEELDASLGFRNDFFVLQISHDYSFNRLAEAGTSSYEVCASFNLRNKENRRVLTSFEAW